MFCNYCGVEIPNGTRYCPKCGSQQGPTKNSNSFNNNQMNNNYSNVSNQKSKIAAGLLGIFLGALGIHNFYLGYTGKGVAQLLLTLLGWLIVIGPFAAAIWAFIEAIMIFTGSINVDAKGIPLRD